MRTDIDILSMHEEANNGDLTGWQQKWILAAMKEAREEYAKEFAEFTQTEGLMWSDTRNKWVDDAYTAWRPDEIIDRFNTHLAAIEAEKEGGGRIMGNKKDCYTCKAYELQKCCLGYATEKATPLEDCPQPKSTKKLVEIMIKQREQK